MKQTVLSLMCVILITLNNALAQNANNKIEYTARGIYMISNNKSGAEELRKPMGKDVYVSYDIFFKSYSIIYTDENGAGAPFNLSYIKDENFVKNVKTTKMKDEFGNIFYVSDVMDQIGQLKILIPKQYSDGSVAWIIVEGAKRLNQ